MIRARATSVHGLRVTGRRADRVSWRLISPVRGRHATACHHEQHAGHRQARPLLGCSPSMVSIQNGLQLNADKSEVVFLGTAAQLRSVAAVTTVDVCHRKHSTRLTATEDRRLTPTFRHPREKRRPGVQLGLSHPRSAPRALFTDGQRRSYNRVQYKSPPDSTTATPFCAAHLRRHWTNVSVFRIIWRESSANVEDALTLARCLGHSTGFQ